MYVRLREGGTHVEDRDQSPTLAKPTGYSYAIKKSGTPVFISGQVALDAEGKLVGENDAAAQTEQIFKNLQAVVEGCGGTLDDVVKITIFVTDPSYRPARRGGAPQVVQGRAVAGEHAISWCRRWRCRRCWSRSKRLR